MKIVKTSILTGIKHTMDLPVTQDELDRHFYGEHAQDVWPHLTSGQREFLISGITEEEWSNEFGNNN